MAHVIGHDRRAHGEGLGGQNHITVECLWISRCHRAATGADMVDRVLADG